MRMTRGKIIIIAIFVAIAAGLVGLIQLTNLETDVISPDVEIMLADVEMKRTDVDNPDLMYVEVDLTVFNGTGQTLALSRIDYDLSANGEFVGRGGLSLEDIPLTGRAPIFVGSSTTFPTEMKLLKEPENETIWEKLKNDNTEDITWTADGMVTVETALSIIEIEFVTELPASAQ